MALRLYYITHRYLFPGDAVAQERQLLAKIGECAAAGVDLIQLREKDLSTRALEELAGKAVAALGNSATRLLINSRTDVAMACGADGVHLPANDLPASEVRAVITRSALTRTTLARAGVSAPVIGVSAHSLADVASAEAHGADFAVFAPVFEKGGAVNSEGLEQLRRICHRGESAQPPLPVLALGGITLENARQCVEAGAAGIAAIRLFQQNDVHAVVKKLRESALSS
ncbi:MAG TPA: thiamine phosphate synthase [Candidatus Angelobacter sp.]|nr:thiamine phosphate synthase [Candidatus Angelobacter sp.]